MTLENVENCGISALNNKAIQLVQQGEGRNAVKVLLQALSTLKLEVCSGKTCASAAASDSGAAFVRIALPSQCSADNAALSTYDTLFGITSCVNPCAPQQRDGSTACLLYNMALSHQRCTNSVSQPKARVAHLKKAAMTYNMAFSAAQHWKRWTDMHSGYQILSLAIVNNLLVIHYELGNTEKVAQLHTLLRDTLFGQKGDHISSQELSLFAKNLSRCTGEAPPAAPSVAASSGSCTTSGCDAGTAATAAHGQPTLIVPHSA
ncbi:expressed unknown protein [Seminavis robusta]|uniref:Uncharacterized protein n=1 Tax=Seminavis robusta TaxID=568900 RepID=A0A9N8F050_9STRA|nr:expressed unknown protein [Seminavis robusta]|eukprot:Sro2317_g323000.1 n/a (262) ;mRNA; r:2149-2934